MSASHKFLNELSDSRQSAEAETSANGNKDLKTRAKGNDVIANVIFANQHLASTLVTSSPFYSRHAAIAPLRACSQANLELTSNRSLWGCRGSHSQESFD